MIDTISWRSHHDRVMQLNWLYLYGICQMIPLKLWPNTVHGCNHQSTCMTQLQPLCSAALIPNVLPRRDKGSGILCSDRSLIENVTEIDIDARLFRRDISGLKIPIKPIYRIHLLRKLTIIFGQYQVDGSWISKMTIMLTMLTRKH